MDLSHISDKQILTSLYVSTLDFHNTLRAEELATHVLEGYGIYHKLKFYEIPEKRAEMCLKEAERRNLALQMDMFKYEPSFSIGYVTDLIKKICAEHGKEGEIVLPRAIEYAKTNADRILDEGLVKKID